MIGIEADITANIMRLGSFPFRAAFCQIFFGHVEVQTPPCMLGRYFKTSMISGMAVLHVLGWPLT